MVQLITDVRSRLERLAPFGWMLVGMVFLYVLWVLVTRDLAWGPRGKSPEQILPWLLGTEAKILAFYSTPVMIRGEPGTICYGVLNVKSVRLDPPVEPITPSLNRCIAVAPKQTTVYTLYAEGNDGKQLTASFTVVVKPPPPSFLFVSVSAREVVRRERYAICYGVKNAVAVRLEPSMGVPTPPAKKHCVLFYPPVSMEFRLSAQGEDGTVETMKIPVRVLERQKRL